MTDFGKVAVLLGGKSAEREVSLISGSRILEALRRQGVDAHAFDPAERKLEDLEGFNRVFIALHGRYGEDGTIQGLLELMHIPYTGSGVMASAVGMDKWRSKLLWRSVGLPLPEFVLLNHDSDFERIGQEFGLPLFVKPSHEGSSIGISMVKDSKDIRPAYELAAKYDSVVLAERALLGGEYTVAILDNEALPTIKIEVATEFYDYDAKYLRDDTVYRCPCGLPETREQELRTLALKAFHTLGGRGWGRIDFLMDGESNVFLLEANTVPGMTDHSLVPMAARVAGISYDQLVMRVLSQASLG